MNKALGRFRLFSNETFLILDAKVVRRNECRLAHGSEDV